MLRFMESPRVRHDRVTELNLPTHEFKKKKKNQLLNSKDCHSLRKKEENICKSCYLIRQLYTEYKKNSYNSIIKRQ